MVGWYLDGISLQCRLDKVRERHFSCRIHDVPMDTTILPERCSFRNESTHDSILLIAIQSDTTKFIGCPISVYFIRIRWDRNFRLATNGIETFIPRYSQRSINSKHPIDIEVRWDCFKYIVESRRFAHCHSNELQCQER